MKYVRTQMYIYRHITHTNTYTNITLCVYIYIVFNTCSMRSSAEGGAFPDTGPVPSENAGKFSAWFPNA